MLRYLLPITILICCSVAHADDVTDRLQHLVEAGNHAEAERDLQLLQDASPQDDRIRFALGVTQFLRAIEHLGQSLYEFGAVSENSSVPFLRLPVPQNPRPAAVSYRSIGRVLDIMLAELERAEASLAAITADDVILPLQLDRLAFSFTRDADQQTSLVSVLTKLNNNTRPQFLQGNDGFLVHFDRGDVAWLRGYCHLLCAMIDGYRSVEMPQGFGSRIGEVFPRVEFDDGEKTEEFWLGLRISDPIRLRRCREHLVQVAALNRETWHHIRLETDDSHEWLPHPGQTDQLGMPLTDVQIGTWLGMMQELEDLLSGRSLVPSPLLQFITQKNPSGMGLNLAKLFNDPPGDLFNYERIRNEGIELKYLEPEQGRQLMDFNLIFRVGTVFSGPFGPWQAVRLN